MFVETLLSLSVSVILFLFFIKLDQKIVSGMVLKWTNEWKPCGRAVACDNPEY